MNESLLRELIAAAQEEALLKTLRTWESELPAEPKAWLVTVAWRKYLDAMKAESSRLTREVRVASAPPRSPFRVPR